jgi:purine-binding chemotaxis protein CheW
MTEYAVRKYLIFTLSGRRYAFDLAQVAEVVEKPAIWPIPLAPPCYHGAINFHGTIVAVMDLAVFLQLPGDHGTQKIIILDTRIAALAFSVEDIVRITPQGQIELSGTPEGEAFARGHLDLPEGKVILLDAAAIAEHAAETVNG